MKVKEVIINQANVQETEFEQKGGGLTVKTSFKVQLEGLQTTVFSNDGLIDIDYEGPVEIEGNFTTSTFNNKVYGSIEVSDLWQLQRVKNVPKKSE
jgi:hypothetical protein